ncbi:MAG: cystathionine gamma-synthase [Propionibacteriaceae bacterium]|jgi:cystathionine gamma-synthase|nr:cystathionine gamma-synthase [Propionibacteriaceae bacterium]
MTNPPPELAPTAGLPPEPSAAPPPDSSPAARPATRATRAGLASDRAYAAVVPPIYLSSTYAFDGLDGRGPYDYSRTGNPTRRLLADALADLEGGAGAEITASGLGAATAAVHALTAAGDLVVAPHDCYGGTWRLFDALARQGRLRVQWADLTQPDAAGLIAAQAPRLVWIETPSNPLLRITDIANLSTATHEAGGLVVVDNTFLSPVFQTPLALGADVVVHSTTKYINGHSDVVGGAVIAKDPGTAENLRWWCNTLGLPGGAFDSYLALRGLRTLHRRMAAHGANAAQVAEVLGAHPAVKALHYPGRPDHPGHALAARQQHGFGGIVSFDVGSEAAARRLLDGLRFFSLAESLGGVESLICHPGLMTHAAMPPAVQQAAGITPGLLRLSVGIEDISDLVADLSAGLERAAG